MSKVLFPHESMRPIQKEIVKLISEKVDRGEDIIMHAPTGLGKTAASIAPTLIQALDKGKTIYFLTSKNTQHKIAVETLKAIRDKFHIALKGTDIVGKKWMCIQPGVTLLGNSEFNEYCRTLREEKKCEFFESLKEGEKLSPTTQIALKELNELSPVTVEQIVNIGEEHKLCPYELGMLLAAKSQVIITDYYYLFHPKIRDTFFKKNGKNLEDAVIIIDEGHNLPYRIKDLASVTLSTTFLKRAATEAKKFEYQNMFDIFEQLVTVLEGLIVPDEEEAHVELETFINAVNSIAGYTDLIEECHRIGDVVREEQKISSIGIVGDFLDAWLGSDEGFTRIITRKKGSTTDVVTLSYRCLDPSVISKEVINTAYATILMSGTLTPTKMYAALLGFDDATTQKEFPSPFPPENRLNLIVAKTSTKFTARSTTQYRDIAKICGDIINATPGNSIIFFPSYRMKEQVYEYMSSIEKTVFQELPGMSAQEKEEMIEKFRSYKKTGATLLAVVAGSFGEGVDLPGDELKTVVVVGLPLSRPDLETNALIEYYDKKFKNGWNYGYVYPAFNKVIQNAGRCIRSETDKGVIVFLDERYTLPRYYHCFPESWKIKVSVNGYKEKIERFFGGQAKQQTLF